MKDAEFDFYGQYVSDIERVRIGLISCLEDIISEIDSEELIAEHMKSRVKKADSACEKLSRAGFPATAESALENLSDVIGIRIVTRFVGDIYTLLDAIENNANLNVTNVEDYIAAPKESGYRSLHLVVLVPVFQAARTERMPVEIQLRTIAKDTWASLEHELKYKKQGDISEEDRAELIACAKILADVDERMQKIHHRSILGPIAQG
jgi:putative GTP pyrophosphokinase